MRESRPYGSVRGDGGNPVPYRDHLAVMCGRLPRRKDNVTFSAAVGCGQF